MAVRFTIIILIIGLAGYQTKKLGLTEQQPYEREAKSFIQSYCNSAHLDSAFNLEGNVTLKYIGTHDTSYLNDTIDFTAIERAEILKQMTHPKILAWTADMVPNATTIARDSINAIFGGDIDDGWGRFYEKYGPNLNSFGQPIFLRDNTLCLFYADYICGSLCGRGALVLYKKIGKTWVPIRKFSSWIS